MSEIGQIGDDVGFVRDVIERSEAQRGPSSVYYLWAAITLVGFPLADIVGPQVGMYWAIAGPIGGAITYFLSQRAAVRRGRMKWSEGRRHAMHWNAMMVALVLSVIPVATGAVEAEALSPIILLIVTLSYFLAGVHLDRTLGWISILMVGGYFLVLFVPVYPWTITGVLVSSALASAGFRMDRRSETS